MLEKRVERVKPAQPAVAPASCWSELLDHQRLVAFLSLLPALAVLAVVVYPFFSAIWITFHRKMVGRRPSSFGARYEPLVEQYATT